MILAAPFCISLGGCGERAEDPRGVDRDEVLLQVVATGRTDARPDEARFTAGVQTTAATAAAASEGNNRVMGRVAAELERLGVKPVDLQTRQITLGRIDYGPQRGQFQANNMVEVRIRDIAKAGQAIAATTQAGANVLSGPNMTVGDPEAASRSAYAQAYKAARARAEAYAAAAGLKVGRVLSIRDTGEGAPVPYYDVPPPPTIARTMSVQAESGPPVRAGMNVSQVQVRADFALAPK
jgi:hypothetical protein